MKPMDKSDLFDQKIRDAVDKYEVPFDDSLWKNIEKEINTPAKVFNWKPWAASVAIAASLLIAYIAFKPTEDVKIDIVEKQKTNQEAPKQIEETNSDLKENTLIDDESVLESASDENQNSITINSEEDLPKEAIDNKEEVVETDLPLDKEDEILPEVKSNDDESIIDEEERLLVSIHINKEYLCQNEALNVSLNLSNSPVEIVWDFGDGYVAEGPNVSHIYNEAGTYELKLHAKSVLDDKLVEDESYSIVVNPVPVAQFDIQKNENMYALPEVSFETVGSQFASLEWKFKDENITNNNVVEKMFKEKGIYNVGLVVKNQFQCSDTLYQKVVIENDYNLLAPNAFSPNGDGINDTFMPQAIPYLNQNFTLQVFDPKTSQLIFESKSFDIPWNGNMMNNGNKMKEGAYAWSVKTDDGSIYKGTILITAK